MFSEQTCFYLNPVINNLVASEDKIPPALNQPAYRWKIKK